MGIEYIDELSSSGWIERQRRSLKRLHEYRVYCILMLQYIAQTYELIVFREPMLEILFMNFPRNMGSKRLDKAHVHPV